MNNTNNSTIGSFSNASDDHESLGHQKGCPFSMHPFSMQARRVQCHLAEGVSILSKIYTIWSALLSGSPTITYKYVFISCTIKKKTIMDNFWIINFNKWMVFQVYKCGGCSHDNINDEIIDGNVFVSVESSFQKS